MVYEMTVSEKCFVVTNGYEGNENYIDGNIMIFSTREKAERYLKKLQEESPEFYKDNSVMEFDVQ